MISVCMATFNGARFIKQQIESILTQLGPEDELVISDDGSTDNTLPIIQSFQDQRIRLTFSGKQNVIKNFENALGKARGDYIFLADQDDIWHPNKVKICMAELEKGARLVLSDCTVVDENDHILEESFFKIHPPRKTVFGNLYKNSFMGCCMAFRRSLLKKALPFPEGIPMHDSWIGGLALVCREPVAFLDEKLVRYRRHGNTASSTGEKSVAPLQKQIRDRFILAGGWALRFYGMA